MPLKIIKVFTVAICILLTVTIALKMPDTLFKYIDKKSLSDIEEHEIEQAELDFLTEMTLLEKMSLKNSTSEISLKNGAINNKSSVINIFLDFSYSVCSCDLLIKNINCIPYLRSDNNNSFIVWTIDYITDYIKIHADIDDETGVILSYSFEAIYCDGEIFIDADETGYELDYIWQGYPYVTAYMLAKYYADYLINTILDNADKFSEELTYFNWPEDENSAFEIFADTTANANENMLGETVAYEETEAEADYISSVVLILFNRNETPIKIETDIGHISLNR